MCSFIEKYIYLKEVNSRKTEAVEYPQMNGSLKPFREYFWQPKHCKYFPTFLRAVHPVFIAFIGFSTSSFSWSSQTRFFSWFLLFCQVLAAFVLSADIFCPDFLSCSAIFIAFSELILLSRQLALVKIFFHLHHMNMSVLNFKEFFSNLFHYQRWTIAEPSLARDGRHEIAMSINGSLGMSWPSVSCTSLSTGTFRPRFQAPSVSPKLRGNVALKAL